jgi:hypothetical protein
MCAQALALNDDCGGPEILEEEGYAFLFTAKFCYALLKFSPAPYDSPPN